MEKSIRSGADSEANSEPDNAIIKKNAGRIDPPGVLFIIRC